MKAYQRLAGDAGETMPAHRPYYPAVPSYYREVESQWIFFRTDPAIVREYLPEPLEPDPEGIAMAGSLRVPFCSAYGPFHESYISLGCTLRGQAGFFDTLVYLDNVAAICAGRERWGAPKEYAAVSFERRGNLITSQTVVGGVPVMTLSSDISRKADPTDVPTTAPSFRLKLIPRADGPGPALKQIITFTPADVRSTLLMAGNGMIEFHSTSHSDLAPFRPRQILGAFYEVSTFTEGFGEIVYDYLA